MADPSVAERLKAFNDFTANARKSTEESLKTVSLVSGGLLTLSVGAVLSRAGANIPADQVLTLQIGWALLFWSIAAAMLVLLGMQTAVYKMQTQWMEILRDPAAEIRFVRAHVALRTANMILGISSVLSCVGGVLLMACVALHVAKALARAVPGIG